MTELVQNKSFFIKKAGISFGFVSFLASFSSGNIANTIDERTSKQSFGSKLSFLLVQNDLHLLYFVLGACAVSSD